MESQAPESAKGIEVKGALTGILTCDYCKWNHYKIGLFQKDNGRYFLGLNCAKCGASVTAIEDIQEYAKAVTDKLKQ